MAGFLRDRGDELHPVASSCLLACLYVHMRSRTVEDNFMNYILGKICRQLGFLKIWDNIMAT